MTRPLFRKTVILINFSAVAFHRTAFKDRIDSVKGALRTIDHLRQYRPKRADRSSRLFGGSHTPGFALSSLGFGSGSGATPFNEKSEFITGSSRNGTPETDDEGHADHEDNSGFWSKRKGKAKQRESRPSVPKVFIDETHSYPPKASPIDSGTASGSGTPHRPGTPIGRKSHDEDGAVLHAAKALKSAVLHDARNFRGDADENEGITGLGWNVGSAHEAKVILVYLSCLLTTISNYSP